MSQSKLVSSSAVSRSFNRSLVALVLATVFVAGSAGAQIRAVQPVRGQAVVTDGTLKGQAATVTYKQKTSYDFDDDQVEGTVVQPDSDLISGRSLSKQDSLVRLRTTFQPEMLKSVETL